MLSVKNLISIRTAVKVNPVYYISRDCAYRLAKRLTFIMSKWVRFITDEVFIIRVLLILVVGWLGWRIGLDQNMPMLYTVVSLALALIFVVVEYSTKIISSKKILLGAVGLLIGLVIAQLVFVAPPEYLLKQWQARTLCNLIFGYLGLIVALKNAHYFDASKLKFIVTSPATETKVLDTSVIIDGRILDLVKQQFLQGPFMLPEFVLKELQTLADSTIPTKRAKGRRGLEILDAMQELDIDLTVLEKDFPDIPYVDHKLIQVAQKIGGILVTNDYNLHKVAQLHGVTVLNLNELANAMKPSTFIGEIMQVQITKEGKEARQGVGHLEDGTMVVVEDGEQYIGSEIEINVSSILQTSAGRMIFAKPHHPQPVPQSSGSESRSRGSRRFRSETATESSA